ncbi:hypothetical protein A5745_09670 [Mycobacterium sp. IS-2888]|uniref:DUF3349 domain-containing protein n=1 Tax=Mycobacterium sp. IS-2888 TaxID=1834159 RepID=UPI00096E23C1|nr:DUF3349 domain-containing protein [Mycobacterium sp. IS-2888]OMC48254.1 hypothetical protein A5745_09670 [Mycobacterium sp. IS-2888]
MSMGDRVAGIVAFLRAGYPSGTPAVGYVPLLALLPRRASDDEIRSVISKFGPGRRPVEADFRVDVGVEIARVTHEMPLPDDIERVQRGLTAI